MSIRFSKYIDITSAVEGASQIRERQLILRVFSTNSLIPTNSFAEFFTADEVGAYFNTTSAEYKIAVEYFAFISKNATQPPLISYSSWVNANVAPKIFGAANATDTLAQFNLITNGNLALTIGTFTHTLTAIDLSGAGSLAAVATAIQTAVRTQTGTPDWATATVTYNSTAQAFDLVGGVVPTTGTVPVGVAPSGGVDVGVALGWQDILTIYSYGSAAVSLTDTMIASVGASSNFGTFYFIPTLNQTQNVELATWLAATTPNVQFMFLVPVTAANAVAMSGALFNFAGVAMTLSPLPEIDYPEIFPGMILAATNYDNRNASQNYMYQQGNFTPSVTDDADSDNYDIIRVNYYGQTQTAGNQIAFYQRGVLCGLATAPTDMNVYANEMWFKNAMGDMFMNLLLALTEIPANNNGRAILLTGSQNGPIAQALFNGTISVGNPLSQVQIAAIGQITGSPTAWRQINTIGYWINFEFTAVVTQDSRTEYEATYTLVYTKNNAIRKVVGSHILI